MENVDHCFFCCKSIPKGDNLLNDNFNESFISFNCDTSTYKTESSKSVTEYVLRISQYLKIPKEVIEENEDISPSIKTCQDCTEISRNLSDLCVQYEAIKLKIRDYLSLLTDKIPGITTNERDDDGDNRRHQHTSLSNLQKQVHKNCLLKVRKGKETSTPKIRHEICPISTQEDDEPEALTIDIKLENSPVKSYPFGDSLALSTYQIGIGAHHHTDQIQTEDKEEELSSCENCGLLLSNKELWDHKQLCWDKDKGQKSKLSISSNAVNCEKCGGGFSNRGKLNRHLRESLKCGNGRGRTTEDFKDRFECSTCNKRFSRRTNLYRHFKRSCENGVIIDHGEQASLSHKKGRGKQRKNNSKSEPYEETNDGESFVEKEEDVLIGEDPLKI